MSMKEIARVFDISTKSVHKRLRRLRAKKLVRVVRYVQQPDGQRGAPTPFYGLGDPAEDVPRPGPTPHRERARAYEARKKRRSVGLWGQLLA